MYAMFFDVQWAACMFKLCHLFSLCQVSTFVILLKECNPQLYLTIYTCVIIIFLLWNRYQPFNCYVEGGCFNNFTYLEIEVWIWIDCLFNFNSPNWSYFRELFRTWFLLISLQVIGWSMVMYIKFFASIRNRFGW